jgi:hypothetical protein
MKYGVGGEVLGVVETDAVGEKLREGAVSSESVLEVDCWRRRNGGEREGRRYVANGTRGSEGILSA